HSLCEGRRTHDWSELGDLYGDGRAGVCGALAPRRCYTWSDARHEHFARRPRAGSACRPADRGPLGGTRTVWMASACAMIAHAGGSTVWVFSTTLLQLHTDDRFRGRVFSADLGFSMLTIAAGA